MNQYNKNNKINMNYKNERGSLVVATALFMFLFLGLAAFGIDASRHFSKSKKLQSVADKAALVGGQVFNRYSKTAPDTKVIRQTVLDHVEKHLGDDYIEQYPKKDKGVFISSIGSSSKETCKNNNTTVPNSKNNDCYPKGTYRIGVLVSDTINYYFWPSWFTDKNGYNRINKKAVAQVIPKTLYHNPDKPRCGLYTGGVLSITGNNLNAQNVNFCGSGGIDADQSRNGQVGDLYAPEGAPVSLPGGSSGTIRRVPGPQPAPSFKKTNPDNYMANLNNFDSWTDYGVCSGKKGKGGGGTTKALRTSSGSDAVWSKSGAYVCITKDKKGGYTIDNNSGGQIQQEGGSSISIYADNSVTFSGNNNGIDGGLYSDGDIEIAGNDYHFNGDPDVKGGLALWADGNVDFDKNNIRIDGITGAGGQYNFGSKGGGNGPVLNGVLSTGGSFVMNSNSNNASIQYDPSKYDPSVLTDTWASPPHERVNQPLYANIDVALIH